MEVHQYHSNITQKRHGASRNYRYVLDVSTSYTAYGRDETERWVPRQSRLAQETRGRELVCGERRADQPSIHDAYSCLSQTCPSNAVEESAPCHYHGRAYPLCRNHQISKTGRDFIH